MFHDVRQHLLRPDSFKKLTKKMKKSLFTTAMLFAVLMVQAQNSVTITPKLKVGMEKNYTMKAESTTPGSVAADVSMQISYKVAGKTSNGYQVNMSTSGYKIDVNQLMQNMNAMDVIQMLNTQVELLTDKNGAATGINSKELIDKYMAMMDSIFKSAMDRTPDMKDDPEYVDAMTKIINIPKELITEDALLEGFSQTPNIMALNGKTISNGMVEDGKYAQFFKTKSTYTISDNGKTIVQATKADMDIDSMKEYILKIIGSILPESVAKETSPEQLSSIIESMINSGTMKMGLDRNTTYYIGDDGWVRKMVMEMSMELPGVSTKTRNTITLKD